MNVLFITARPRAAGRSGAAGWNLEFGENGVARELYSRGVLPICPAQETE